MSKVVKGTILTIIAGIAWSLSGISGQYLLDSGISALSLTNLRLLLAGGALTFMAYLADRQKFQAFLKDKKALLYLLVFGILGLFMNQFSYLLAIKETNAGTATVLQYVCPVLVLAYTCIKERTSPTFSELCSIGLAVGGTALIATHGQLDQLSVTPAGLFWGLFSAFTYAVYLILPARLIREWGSMLVIGVGMLIAGVLLFPFGGLPQFSWDLSVDMYLALAGIVLVGTILAYTLFLKGSSMIGPVKASLLAAIEPISAVILAFFLLGEDFNFIDILGIIMILLAVSLISLKDLLLAKKKGIL